MFKTLFSKNILKCKRRNNYGCVIRISNRKNVVYSAIQPTGSLHLGNYLGAVKNWVDLQDENMKCFYSVADFHAITLPYDHTSLHKKSLSIACELIACGIDPDVSTLYLQSHVTEHAHLCWILSSFTTLAKLERLPNFKEKSSKFINKSAPTGLLLYPVLQAADILLHKASCVPIGEDQLQHLNLAINLTKMFNERYGKIFPIPEPLLFRSAIGNRIKSLRNPLNKMSKSDESSKSRIEILDSPEVIVEKISKAVTDCTSAVFYNPEKRPGVSNLMAIHQCLTGKSFDDIEREAANIDTGKYKKILADIVIHYLSPIRKKVILLEKDKSYLEKVLCDGAKKAKISAEKTIEEVCYKMGFK